MTLVTFRLLEKANINLAATVVAFLHDPGYQAETIFLKIQLIVKDVLKGEPIDAELVFWLANKTTLPQNDIDKDGKVIMNVFDNRREEMKEILESDTNVNIIFDDVTHEVSFSTNN